MLRTLWQLRHKRHLDGILQCGDLGYFPDLSRIDDATRRFADEDPRVGLIANVHERIAFASMVQERTVAGEGAPRAWANITT